MSLRASWNVGAAHTADRSDRHEREHVSRGAARCGESANGSPQIKQQGCTAAGEGTAAVASRVASRATRAATAAGDGFATNMVGKAPSGGGSRVSISGVRVVWMNIYPSGPHLST